MIQYIMFFNLITMGRGDTEESKLVNIEQGPVRGYKEPGDNIFVFYGIPYATAPRGVDKFKAPLPPPTWSEPFEAIDKNVVCFQMNSPFLERINGVQTGDCLIANIFVPDTKKTNLPVLIYVHGGAYQIGFGNLVISKNLIRTEPMIIVNFNYRLGPIGFLCLGTPDVPGNAGLKDQVAAFRWVKKNIASFGGNPDDVTIIGYSAGASSVELQTLSPMTKGLFNKVILDSGSSVAVFSVIVKPVENAKAFAKLLNFSAVDDVFALEEFYKTVPEEVMSSIDVFRQKDSTFYFSPCVERDVGQEIFLNDAPINILKAGKQYKVPTLYGFAEMEGLFRMPLFDFWKDDMNSNFSDFLPGDLHFNSETEKEKVAESIKSFYFGHQTVSEHTIFRYIDYFTDVLFAYPILRSVRLQVESGNNNIYLYQYDFVDESVPLIPYTKVRGPDHIAQTFDVADDAISEINLSEDYKNVKQLLRNIWTNFITKGSPVLENSSLPNWPPAQANGGHHMCIDKSLKLRGPLLQQRVLFWHDIYEKYYDFPTITAEVKLPVLKI